MKPEDIKACIDMFKPEGFNFSEEGKLIGEYQLIYTSLTHNTHSVAMTLDKHGKRLDASDYIYSLFLQRIIEVINNLDLDYYIEVCKAVTIVNSEDGADFQILLPECGYFPMDQVKEKAILYVLTYLQGKEKERV